jgi:hypothetical protein
MLQRSDVAVAHLYAAFRDHLSAHLDLAAADVLADVARFSRIYRGFDTQSSEGREGLFFRRLRAMEVTSLLPAVLDIHAQCEGQPDQRVAALVDLESFLVRRMVCQLNTRGYSRLFVELLVALGGKEGTVPERVRAFLLSSSADSARWPDDKEFEREWGSAPLYKRVTRSRLRLLLEALDGFLTTGKTEKVLVGENLTVEHLMPRSWRQHWPLPVAADPGKAVEAREQLIHTVGNLTLVTGKLNPSLSNAGWAEKRAAIRQHTALTLNREVQDSDVWDEDTIRRRGHELFDGARTIWPHPVARPT